MLKCIKCKEILMEVPVFNNAQDEDFPPTFPFCNNTKCERFGLLTMVFTSDDDKKSKHKKL